MKNACILFLVFIFSNLLLAQEEIKSYQNYDFIPGNKIIFEDNFTSGIDGEFPPMWKLVTGQGVVNKINGELAFVLTDGNYAKVAPRIKAKNYLDKSFSVECDFYPQENDFGILIFFLDETGEDSKAINIDPQGYTSSNYFPENQLSSAYPEGEPNLIGKWNHVAIAYKDGQMKCYINQFRALVIPDCEFKPLEVRFGGLAPIRFKNVKIANGSGMNMIDQIYKEGKFITHGILFDVNKADIKPSSMGVLNDIAKMMKEHSDLKFRIEGHTDSDGDDKSNLKLSEQRAESVKKALTDLGVDGARFQTKGWGESKPIDKNDSPEGKANNRRVEFVKI